VSLADQVKAERIKLRRFPRIWLHEARSTSDDDYIIKGILPRASLAVIYGPWGCGKSFQAIDFGGHVACGLPWRGHRVRRGPVV
jgi:RecA-family ATPase